MSHKDEETQKARLRRILYIWVYMGYMGCPQLWTAWGGGGDAHAEE
jgi:hypothetical protein